VTTNSLVVWNAWGLFSVIPLVACVAMGVFVVVTRPDRAQNRRLGAFLIAQAIVTFASPAGAAFAGADTTARVFFVLHFVSLVATMPLSLSFLATIDTPATKPLGTRTGRWLTWAVAAAIVALFVARPTLFILGFREPWWGGRMFIVGPFGTATYVLSGLTSVYSLIVAISAYRRAVPGSITKERAKRYAIAFGVNDVFVMLVTTIVPGVYSASHGGDIRAIEFIFVWAMPVSEVTFVVLMTYGILRTQLFDIDLRLLAGLRRGALAAIVLFAFVTASEIAQSLVSEEFGYVIGAVAAAALLFVHKPVEHLAARFSAAVLPGVEPSPAYVAFRKLEVYADAVEAAYEDGEISPPDRVILKRLAAKLGVAAHDAAHIEEDTRRARSQNDGRAAARQEASVV